MMESVSDNLSSVIKELYSIGCIQFGDFTLKSGLRSPVYVDLRRIISKPSLMVEVCDLIWNARRAVCLTDVICGVPYTALPFATVLSVKHDVPMVMRRKETKSYGMKQKIEGVFEKGQRCMVIEDIISSGSSILETLQDLKYDGLEVSEVIVFLDRQHGGLTSLRKSGLTIEAVCNLTQVLNVVRDAGHLSEETVDNVKSFLEKSSLTPTLNIETNITRARYGTRAEVAENAMSRRLLNIMEKKWSNICLAVDVDSMDEILKMASLLGHHLVVLKTHIDCISDFSIEKLQKLKKIAQELDFLIFEDRKFADIGAIVKKQYDEGSYRMSEWADFVTVHGVAGDGPLQAIMSVKTCKGVLLVAQMSSKGNLITQQYTTEVLKMAKDHKVVVSGIISQSRLSSSAGLLHFTPGVRMEVTGDSLGQQYVTPETAVLENGADVIIVGRGITEAEDPLEALLKYKHAGYEAYLKRVSNV